MQNTRLEVPSAPPSDLISIRPFVASNIRAIVHASYLGTYTRFTLGLLFTLKFRPMSHLVTSS